MIQSYQNATKMVVVIAGQKSNSGSLVYVVTNEEKSLSGVKFY